MSKTFVSEMYENCNISVYDAIVFFLNTYFIIIIVKMNNFVHEKMCVLLIINKHQVSSF